MKFDLGSIPTRIGKSLQRVFGSANERAVRHFHPMVEKVNALEDQVKPLDQEQIDEIVDTYLSLSEIQQKSLKVLHGAVDEKYSIGILRCVKAMIELELV